jgi:hypothetical protein
MAAQDETRPQEGTGLAEQIDLPPSTEDHSRREAWRGWREKTKAQDPVIDEAITWMIDHGWLDLGDPPRFTPPEVAS